MQLLNILQQECVIADTFISLKVSKKQQSSAYKKSVVSSWHESIINSFLFS